MDKINNQLETLLRALQLRFKGAYALQQMLLKSGSQQAIDAAIRRCGASLGYNQ
jgi:hypothetical protein